MSEEGDFDISFRPISLLRTHTYLVRPPSTSSCYLIVSLLMLFLNQYPCLHDTHALRLKSS